MPLPPGTQLAPQASASSLMPLADAARNLSVLSQDGSTAPVVVRNNLNSIVSFTDETTRISNIWAAANDPHGGHVKEVPPSLLRNPQFREMVLREIFSVEGDPEVLENALDRQRQHWRDRQQLAADAAIELHKSADQVVAMGQACIAPRGRGELCGSYSLVMGNDEAARRSTPPLCAEHQNQAALYQPSMTGREIDGQQEIIWRRIGV